MLKMVKRLGVIFILELVIFNLILILIITALLFFSKRYVKSERARSALLTPRPSAFSPR